jgi:hypothetical protein
MSGSGIKRALLVGIDYIKNPAAKLNGCIEDIKNIQNMLIDAYGYSPENMIILRDDISSRMPTKTNIINALQSVVSMTGVKDELWFHYSGHGTQLRDTNRDESDGADEAIVPVDYPTAGMIIDDDLFNMVRSIKGKAFLVFDSCHSGSVCDLQYSINYVSGSFSRSISSKKILLNPNIVVLSGCRDAQTSADTYDSVANEFGGALTMAITTTLRKNKHSVDIMKLYNDVCYYLLQNRYEQIPVLSSSAATPILLFTRPPVVTIATIQSPVSSPIKTAAKSISKTLSLPAILQNISHLRPVISSNNTNVKMMYSAKTVIGRPTLRFT